MVTGLAMNIVMTQDVTYQIKPELIGSYDAIMFRVVIEATHHKLGNKPINFVLKRDGKTALFRTEQLAIKTAENYLCNM